MLVAVLAWWVGLLALFGLGIPVASALFAHCDRRGAGFAPAVGLATLTVVGFWVGHLSMGWVAPLAAVAVLVGVAWVARTRIAATVDRRAAAESLAVLTVAYLGFVGARLVAPDVTPAGEQFLDFALLKAVLRAPALPPADPWFAGEAVPYYYGGHLAVALQARLTGTPARFAYHLGSAGALAVAVAGAYELAASVAPAGRRRAGLLAAFFVGAAGNLVTALYALFRALPGNTGEAIARATMSEPGTVTELLVGKLPFSATNVAFVVDGGVSMFPSLEALTGYMHAHVLVTPLLVLAAGLGLAYYRTPASDARRRWAILLGAVPPVCGAVAITSTWSLPTALGVQLVAVALAPAEGGPDDADAGKPIGAGLLESRLFPGDWDVNDEATRDLAAGAVALAAGLLVVLWAFPFFVESASGRSVALTPTHLRTDLEAYLLIQGPFLAICGGYFLSRVHRRRRAVGTFVVVTLAVLAAFVATPDVLAVVLFAPFVAAAWYLRRADEVGYAAVLVVAGAAVLVVPEFLYVVTDGPGNRFNTVYKTSMQAWILWATVGGALLPAVVRGTDSPWVARDGWGRRLRVAGAVLLVVSTAVYVGFAVPDRLDATETVSLDATAAVQRTQPDVFAAAEWLDDEASGTPTLLSAPGEPSYRWTSSPAASFTGLPTVVGWAHERQYRSDRAFERRAAAVDRIYEGNRRARIDGLLAYDVRYVWVGPAERERYGDVRPFDDLPGIVVAYENDRVTIYRVDRGALSRVVESDGDPG